MELVARVETVCVLLGCFFLLCYVWALADSTLVLRRTGVCLCGCRLILSFFVS